MRLRDVGKSFRGRHKIHNGPYFYGQILDIPDTSRVSNFLSARRYLRTAVKTPIVPATVVIVAQEKYIVGDHGEGFFRNPIYKHFKLFKVDLVSTWYTREDTKNNVTGVYEKGSTVNKGEIFMSVQPKSLIEDSVSIQTPQHTIITNSPLKVDDLIGDNWVVTRVDYLLGVYVAEVKEG